MKNLDLEIARAKKEIMKDKINAWKDEWKNQWIKNNKKDYRAQHVIPDPPSPPNEVIEVKAWFIAKWSTGFVVCDMQELMKRPKKQRDKILALGGLV